MNAGILAEFEKPEQLLGAARRLRDLGYRRMDAFTPWPLPELDEILSIPPTRVNTATLIGGICGAAAGYLVQWWTNAVNYPLIVGSRPAHAWPAFIPITFETMVLFAGFSALISSFVFSGLPRLWHPVFEVEGFESATIDRFWIGVDSEDGILSAPKLEELLGRAGALRVVPFGKVAGVAEKAEPA